MINDSLMIVLAFTLADLGITRMPAAPRPSPKSLLPPAYVVRREGNSFTLFVSPHLGGQSSRRGGQSSRDGGGGVSQSSQGGRVSQSSWGGHSARGSASWGGQPVQPGGVSQLGGSASWGGGVGQSAGGVSQPRGGQVSQPGGSARGGQPG